jgi:hypothetical protein
MNHVVCHLIHAKIIFTKQIEKVCQVHNSVIFSEKHIEKTPANSSSRKEYCNEKAERFSEN